MSEQERKDWHAQLEAAAKAAPDVYRQLVVAGRRNDSKLHNMQLTKKEKKA